MWGCSMPHRTAPLWSLKQPLIPMGWARPGPAGRPPEEARRAWQPAGSESPLSHPFFKKLPCFLSHLKPLHPATGISGTTHFTAAPGTPSKQLMLQ